MKWLILGLLALGLACLGLRIFGSRAVSADERIGNELLTVVGVGIIIADFLVIFI